MALQEDWNKVFPDATLNQVEYLIDGQATFERYAQAIETADAPGHYIYITGWMLDVLFPLTGPSVNKGRSNGRIDKTLFHLLAVASSRQVEIRVLIWDNPLYNAKTEQSLRHLNALPTAKVFVDSDTYTPPHTKKFIFDLQKHVVPIITKVEPLLTNPAARIKELYNVVPEEILGRLLYYLITQNVGSHHEKVLIVKGREGLISFCGGIDINKNRFTSYHDTACRTKGPEAHRILQKFVQRWKHHGEAKALPLLGENDVKPVKLASSAGNKLYAKAVGTYNSPDGREKDRSLKESYLKIIDKAKQYIYIEDQYLVNLDVAKALNKKLKEPLFKTLIIVIQDSRETQDILIPDQKRGEFHHAVIDGLTEDQKKKYFLLMLNDDKAKSLSFHPGLHAKTLIVDDNIAVIGSANVNQRSFTLDSECSLIIFNKKEDDYQNNFAYKLRNTIWLEYLSPGIRSGRLGSGRNSVGWEELPRLVFQDPNNSFLRGYLNNIQDMPIRIYEALRPHTVPITIGLAIIEPDISKLSQYTAYATSLPYLKLLFEEIWVSIVDPIAP